MKSAIRRFAFAALAVAMSQLPTPSHAELIDNGGGLIYDTVLDITWAQPEGFEVMTWEEAKTYASELTMGGVGGWRLPYISVAAGAGPLSLPDNPVRCDEATEVECRDNELEYMFYHNLGGTFGEFILDSGDPDLDLFPNLQNAQYWSGTESDPGFAWLTFFGEGSSFASNSITYPWAVHDGNVTVGGPPPGGNLYADFTFSPTTAVVNQVVQFTDQSQGNPVSWRWLLEDTTALEQNPSTYWLSAGSKRLQLWIWDAAGNEAYAEKEMWVVEQQEPDAGFTWSPLAPEAGEAVQFNDASLGNPTSWEWDFDDGGTSTEQNPVHTFDQAGKYNVKLTVSNSAGTVDETEQVEVYGATQPPEASFFYRPTNPTANEVVIFFNASSGGSADSWEWDFGDGGFSDAEFTHHTFTDEGSFDVTLTVANSAGADSRVRTLNVAPEPPPIDPDLDQVYFVASAARTGGVGDSFFVTDVDVNNAGGGMATYKVAWLPRDTDNSAPTVSDALTIEAGETVRWSDVLGTVFGVPDGTDAAGAVAFVSDSQDLKIFSRTYNSSDAGTFGQAIPGMAAGDLIATGEVKRILFFTENGAYRSNMGFLNGTGTAMTIKWRRYTADGTMVEDGSSDLPAWGNTQLNKVFRGEAPVEGAYIDVWTETAGAAFTAYGSVLDNATSDPTTVLPD